MEREHRMSRRMLHWTVVLMGFALLPVPGCQSENAVEEKLRVSIIGIDGATWRVINPMLAQGQLPNLSSLIEQGVRAPFRSEPPLFSPPIWTTIATGVSRAVHGLRRFELHRG